MKEKFVFVSLFVPVSVCVAALTFLPHFVRKASQLPLVETFQRLDRSKKATLVYTNRMPYSAAFYAQERVKDIPDESVEKVIGELNDNNEDFFVIREHNVDRYLDQMDSLTEYVGKFGGYILRREVKKN